MKKKLSTPLYLGLAVICLSSFVEDAKEKCAKEAADFVQMAVSDGHSWKYGIRRVHG